MWSTDFLFWVFLGTGFSVGFGHCLGMCGPIVISLTLNKAVRPVLVWHLLYHLGRIVTYCLLGAVMGATGSFTIVAAHLAGIQKGALIFSGALIIVMGLAMSGLVPLGRIFSSSQSLDGLMAGWYRRLATVRSPFSYLPIGLLLGLLPCGPVYTALLAAARAGMESSSPLQGMALGFGLMAAFGLGTVPALLLLAQLAGTGLLRLRDRVYKLSALLMVLVGVYFLIKGVLY